MYIQITTRCNMHCDHCGFSCTSKGIDMNFEYFKQLIKGEEYIAIGGGEPTVHPQFEKFLLHAIALVDSICIITNGKLTRRALMLAELNKLDNFYAYLSVDCWHEEVSPKVMAAFTNHYHDTSNNIAPRGRALENEISNVDDCFGQGRIYTPDERIRWCGCPNSPYKDELEGEALNAFYEYDCYAEYLEAVETAKEYAA